MKKEGRNLRGNTVAKETMERFIRSITKKIFKNFA